jgi:hypothetical protein
MAIISQFVSAITNPEATYGYGFCLSIKALKVTVDRFVKMGVWEPVCVYFCDKTTPKAQEKIQSNEQNNIDSGAVDFVRLFEEICRESGEFAHGASPGCSGRLSGAK